MKKERPWPNGKQLTPPPVGFINSAMPMSAALTPIAHIASLRAHGQQTPTEVADIWEEQYGLNSGWWQLSAVRTLYSETGEIRFATVLALPRTPDTAWSCLCCDGREK